MSARSRTSNTRRRGSSSGHFGRSNIASRVRRRGMRLSCATLSPDAAGALGAQLMQFRMPRPIRQLWVPIMVRTWPMAKIWYRAWGLQLKGQPNEDVWYFAYGANMHDSAFRERRRMQPAEWRAGRIKYNHACRARLRDDRALDQRQRWHWDEHQLSRQSQ